MTRSPWTWLAPSLLSALVLLVYLSGIGGGFMFDDTENLSYVLRHLKGELSAWGALISNRSGALGRPVAMLTFLVDGWVSALDPRWMKLVNIALHLASGAVLFALLKRILALAGLPEQRVWVLALWATALWLVLPIQVSTTLYIVQRMTQLSALFVLLALLAYVRGRTRLAQQPRRAGVDLLLWFPLFGVLAVLSKENGVLAPLFALALELALFRAPRPRAVRAYFWLILWLPGLVAAALMATHPGVVLDGYGLRDFTPTDRLLSQPRALFDYLKEIVVPYGPGMGLYHDDFTVSRSLAMPATTMPAILGLLGLLFAAWRYRLRMPLFSAGVFWFLAGHALESTVFPLEIYFEHRNYLPSVGVLLALMGIGLRIAQAMPPLTTHFARILPAIAVLVVLVYASATAARAAIWGTPHLLLTQSVAENPQSFRVRTQLAAAFISADQPDAALEQLQAADVAASPRQRPTVSLLRLLTHCATPGAISPELIAQFEQRAHGYVDLSTGQALKVLSQRFEGGECPGLDGARVARIVFEWIRSAPQDPSAQTLWMAHYHATRMLAATGALGEASIHARIAYANSANNPGVGVLAYQLMSSLGDYDGCKAMLADIKSHLGTDDLATRDAIAVFEAHLASLPVPNTPAREE